MRIIILIAATALLTGCNSMMIAKRDTPFDVPEERLAQYHFWWGLSNQSEPVALKSVCGQREWSSIRFTRNFWQVAVTVATLGIFSPGTVKIECRHSKVASLEMPSKAPH